MDAPPEKKAAPSSFGGRPFRTGRRARFLQFIAQDLAQGFLLLSDLGTPPILNALDAHGAGSL